MKRIAMLVLCLVIPAVAQAGVNPKNGDFYISYTDVKLEEGGPTLELKRTYNSKSSYFGWFGMGWGTPFEMRLTILPDRTAVITENGGGVNSYFHDDSRPRNRAQVEQGVLRIVQAATERDKLDAQAADVLSRKLMGDEEERLNAVRKYGIRAELPPELTLTALDLGYCAGTLKHTPSGYLRDTGCGTVHEFDERLRLVRIEQSGGYRLEFHYADGDRPSAIVDSAGRRLSLAWTQGGQLRQLDCNRIGAACRANYEYDDSRNLIESLDVEGNHYRYDYDRIGDMTRIRYVDGSNLFVTYDGKGAATSVTARDGARTLYEYASDPADPGRYSTRIREIGQDGREESHLLEYSDRRTELGERGETSLSVAGEAGKVTRTLDSKGRLVRKDFAGGRFKAYRYDEASGKIASVNFSNEVEVRYRYDDKRQLVHAESSLGDVCDLGYDRDNRIVRMRTKEGDGRLRDLRFRYDADGRIAEIRPRRMAPVIVSYDEKGEISRAKSKDGTAAADDILAAFRNMLTLIRLAQSE